MFKRLLSEPIVAFGLIGVALFAVFYAMQDHTTPEPDAISVTARDMERIEGGFRAVWNRAPTTEERDALIAAHVRQEVLVREAEALGLDRDDAVIRQRLQQKMEFLLSASADALVPGDADLETYLHANADRYAIDGQVAFQQVYLGQAPNPAVVKDTLAALLAGEDPATLGQRSLLPAALPLSPARAVDSGFGSGMFDQLEQAEPDIWTGPVTSGYGLHLVRITAREPARAPALDGVRDRVEADWRREQAEELSERQFELLRDRYDIQIEEGGA